jgi:hypothetical protein
MKEVKSMVESYDVDDIEPEMTKKFEKASNGAKRCLGMAEQKREEQERLERLIGELAEVQHLEGYKIGYKRGQEVERSRREKELKEMRNKWIEICKEIQKRHIPEKELDNMFERVFGGEKK